MNNLTIEMVLGVLADALENRVRPVLAHDPFAAEQVRLSAAALEVAAQQVDGLAAVRIADNDAMRALFGEAAALAGGDLGDRLAVAARGREPGYRLSELDAEGGRLRLLLVELHAALEDRAGPEAGAMHQRIWRLLAEMEARR
ncbi:hypothetical protein ACFOD9_08930 [Novosphingobium bradum]|uniref:Uncharacterized protein n=1 Tax=Novosphingobium bradum TaxID=1737444 RepID=A0ABV7INU3_9SPHN